MPAGKSKAKPTQRKRAGGSRKQATNDLLAVLVLDMSGSMSGVRDSVVEGFNEYLKGLREDEGETLISLTAFDTIFEHWHVAEPIESVGYLDGRYQPRGGTALYDAIAFSIAETQAKLREMGREDMKILHVTVTDGGENSSDEYRSYPESHGSVPGDDGKGHLAELVRACEAQGNWTFVYLGSAHESRAAASGFAMGMGYVGENAMLPTLGTAGGVKAMTSSLRSASHAHRASPAMASSAFFADAGQTEADYAEGSAAPSSAKAPTSTAKPNELKKGSLSDLIGG